MLFYLFSITNLSTNTIIAVTYSFCYMTITATYYWNLLHSKGKSSEILVWSSHHEKISEIEVIVLKESRKRGLLNLIQDRTAPRSTSIHIHQVVERSCQDGSYYNSFQQHLYTALHPYVTEAMRHEAIQVRGGKNARAIMLVHVRHFEQNRVTT